MSIQILQYEFLGPIKLSEWGPPMEKVVYLILSRQKDFFKIIYADDCEQTSDEKFFINHPSFKCWNNSALEKSLHLAILPMFESGNEERKRISDLIIARYHPICNEEVKEVKPDYKIRQKSDTQKISCPCCGSEMKVDQVLEKSTIIRCTECGISDTRLNS
ncbi:hypothetical protein [Nitrosarchaeum koreense]|uniref:Uncharacterized protein n=1 Tax=Nitrosarchaeum koreense MY1 TaxID=1001994 RepID=F9CYH0_9ARCH|nr:hypothetical protein [Nitrosarchaeum koreense]EGP94132.1 hypothetical protein MY1_1376 [Nitrosarchaeum koreense MY1]